MESSSKFLEICGSRVNYKGESERAKEKEREREKEPNDYRNVALAIAKDPIPSQNGFFYFEVEIINKDDDGIVGVGFCKNPDLNKISKNSYLMPGQDNNSWGYHDDGYLFSSKNSRPYGPSYTTNDTIGCYLNFKERIMFYTNNGANIGVACQLSKASEDLEEKWYPYVGFRSQGGSIEVNFGTDDRKFKYSAMNNDDIGELYGVNCLDVFCDNNLDNQLNNEFALLYRAKSYLIMKMYKEALEDLTKVLEKEQTNLLALTYRGKTNFIIGKYEEALEDLTKVLNNEPENTIALRYRAEIYQIMQKYYESSNDLKKLLKIRPDNEWAIKARDLADKTFFDSILEAFRLDRPDSSMDLFDKIIRKGEKDEGLSWRFEKMDKTGKSLKTFSNDLATINFNLGLFFASDVGSSLLGSSGVNLDALKENLPIAANNMLSLKGYLKKHYPNFFDKIMSEDIRKRDGNPFYYQENRDLLRALANEMINRRDIENPDFSNPLLKNLFLPFVHSHTSALSRPLRQEIELPKRIRFQENWTSGNPAIDKFIKQIQSEAKNFSQIIEWIPFKKFTNVKYIAEGGFGTVYKAVWKDGYILGLNENKTMKREPQITVCLKRLKDSKNINEEFLKEVKNQHEHGGKSAITIYGLTKSPHENDDYMIVMQYAKQGSLRNLLDRKFYTLTWMNKIENLLSIAEGLYAIHKDGFVHKDLHPGNIVNEGITSSYITDFGSCKPISEDSNSRDIFGVLPYIAPEVLSKRNKGYSQKSDIYSYGIIMLEIFNGYPTYYNIPHDITLALKICNGQRPKIRFEIPSLLMVLLNNCLDADPQERPSAQYLVDNLKQYRQYLTNNKELQKQIEEINKSSSNNQHESSELTYQTHKLANYTSELLNVQNVPEPVNTMNADYCTRIWSISLKSNDFC